VRSSQQANEWTGGVMSAIRGHRGSRRSTLMGDKSARKESGKTAASKSLKEKRLAKADKKAGKARSEAVTEIKNR